MTEITRVPLQPIKKGSLTKLWLGVLLAVLVAAGLAWAAMPRGLDVEMVTAGSGDSPQLGDVVFVELPKVGRSLKKAEAAAVVESVKAASDVYAPITGEVIEVNEALAAEPALVNSDAGGKAWFFKLKISDKGELGGLMDEAAYAAHTA